MRTRYAVGRGAERQGQRHGEAGFTLAELLVVIALLGVISGVLAMAFVVSGRSASDTSQRLKESHDAQIASAYLATDVQSATSLTSSTCPTTSSLSGSVNLINFSYDGQNSIASWYYGSTGREQQVVRAFCAPGGGVVSDAPIVHFAGAAPAVTCIDPSSCGAGSKPNKVKLSFTEHNTVSNANDYTFAVSGTRRQYAGAGDPALPGGLPRLLALSSGSGCGGLALSTTGNGSLTVNDGDVIVDSTCTPAVQRSGNGSFGIPSGDLQIVSPGTCSGCTIESPVSRLLPVPDPFGGLTLPDESGRTVWTDGNPAHGPGVYRGTPLSFPNGNTVLAPGEYIVESGFSFAGQATVDGTAGVLLFNGCGLNAPVSCTNNGMLSVTGQVSLNLNPINIGPYAQTNLVFWQPVLNNSIVTIAGNGAANSLSGVVYAPGAASVNLSSGNGGLNIGYVVAPTVSVSGNGVVVIG
jgi:prepilin-type N-terminal cleavage/methylation domain-containing protein